MGAEYQYLKFAHILVAIVALGTSAGLGIVLEFFGRDRTHGAFMLRAIERMTLLVVLPGFILMLATGLWMATLVWPLTTHWVQIALALWVTGVVALGWSVVAIRRQRRLHDQAYGSSQYRLASLFSRISGGAFGLVVVATLYLMVVKP